MPQWIPYLRHVRWVIFAKSRLKSTIKIINMYVMFYISCYDHFYTFWPKEKNKYGSVSTHIFFIHSIFLEKRGYPSPSDLFMMAVMGCISGSMHFLRSQGGSASKSGELFEELLLLILCIRVTTVDGHTPNFVSITNRIVKWRNYVNFELCAFWPDNSIFSAAWSVMWKWWW